MWMLESEGLLQYRQRALVERLGLRVSASCWRMRLGPDLRGRRGVCELLGFSRARSITVRRLPTISCLTRALCHLLILAMVSLSLPYTSARAAMVGTAAAIEEATEARSDRARLRSLAQREDIRAQLQAYGIAPGEALSRVDSLSDREAAEIAGRLDELPAGSDAAIYAALLLVLLLFALIIVYLVNAAKVIVKGVSEGVKFVLEDMEMHREKAKASGHAGHTGNFRPSGRDSR